MRANHGAFTITCTELSPWPVSADDLTEFVD